MVFNRDLYLKKVIRKTLRKIYVRLLCLTGKTINKTRFSGWWEFMPSEKGGKRKWFHYPILTSPANCTK